LASALERLEVSAFGCLLDDLLQHADVATIEHAAFPVLEKLRDDCLNETVVNRSLFSSIVAVLSDVMAHN
jgi:hypothetical protein